MEKIEAALHFFGSYPVWARAIIAGGLLASILTLFFAPRETSLADGGGSDLSQSVILTIEEVVLFPTDPEAEVQVYAFVDGTRYRYPSIGGIEWARTGPSMSSQQFQLPKNADGYEIRFEMKLRDQFGEKDLISQETRLVKEFPYSDDYNLHQRERQTRAASVGAAVRYSLANSQ